MQSYYRIKLFFDSQFAAGTACHKQIMGIDLVNHPWTEQQFCDAWLNDRYEQWVSNIWAGARLKRIEVQAWQTDQWGDIYWREPTGMGGLERHVCLPWQNCRVYRIWGTYLTRRFSNCHFHSPICVRQPHYLSNPEWLDPYGQWVIPADSCFRRALPTGGDEDYKVCIWSPRDGVFAEQESGRESPWFAARRSRRSPHLTPGFQQW